MGLSGGRVHQAPIPELVQLRTGNSWEGFLLDLRPEEATELPEVEGPSLDLEFCIHRGSSRAGGVLVRPWLYEAPRSGGDLAAAAVLVDWHLRELQVHFSPGPAPRLHHRPPPLNLTSYLVSRVCVGF